MRRRDLLRLGGAGVVASLAGCTSLFETRSIRSPPVLEDRPDAVYYPTHQDGMEMVGMQTAGRVACALTYSFPHRFWLVTGSRRDRESVESNHSMHLMVTMWDQETGTVLVGGSLNMRAERNSEVPIDRQPWPMLSQNMGVHFGDNVALPEEGDYEVTIDLEPMDTRLTGALAGEFGSTASVTFDLTYEQSRVQDVGFQTLEESGTKGAVEPMQMGDVPLSTLPAVDELSGDVVGEATSGDGVFVATVLDDSPQGIDASGPYLAVSARTPYNRYPLPMMSLSARVTRDGDSVFDDSLRATLDPDLGYHYGAAVESIESGDSVTIIPDAPPQISRHEGYETAFFDLSEMTLTV